jgi:hypothetical protein
MLCGSRGDMGASLLRKAGGINCQTLHAHRKIAVALGVESQEREGPRRPRNAGRRRWLDRSGMPFHGSCRCRVSAWVLVRVAFAHDRTTARVLQPQDGRDPVLSALGREDNFAGKVREHESVPL